MDKIGCIRASGGLGLLASLFLAGCGGGGGGGPAVTVNQLVGTYSSVAISKAGVGSTSCPGSLTVGQASFSCTADEVTQFNNDGTYSVSGGGQTLNGTYKLSGSTLTQTDQNGLVGTSSVKITGNQLTLTIISVSGTTTAEAVALRAAVPISETFQKQ